MKVHFFSNHKDLEPIKKLLPDSEVIHIAHPAIDPRWPVVRLSELPQILEAIEVENLVANGDYALVALIVLARNALGKKTGFIGMEKLSPADGATKNADGSITHRNVLLPVSIRWV